jgi:hypothetical protein
MIITPIQIAAAFMFLCAMLSLGVIYGRIHWTLKALLVVSSLAFCVVAYDAYQGALGYPVIAKPPALFQFMYGIVHEPASSRGDIGAIYLWLVDPKGHSEPRAIQLPYSKTNRDAIAQAKKKIQAGQQVFMSFSDGQSKDGKGDGAAAPGKNGRPGDQRSSGGGNTVPYKLDSIVLDFAPPPDTLPKKQD